MQGFTVEWVTKNKPFKTAEKGKQKNFIHKTRENLILVDQINRVGNIPKGNYFEFRKLFFFLDTQTQKVCVISS